MPISKEKTPSKFKMTKSSDDPRFLEGYDYSHSIATVFAQLLKLPKPSSDIFMIYEPGVRWSKALPPEPTHWMHLINEKSGISQKNLLTAERFEKALESTKTLMTQSKR